MKDKSAQYKDKIMELYQDPKDTDVVINMIRQLNS
jgi:hypothetical protein